MMKKLLILILLFAGVTGCTTRSKIQRSAVSRFASRTQQISVIHRTLMGELADIRIERGIFYAGSMHDPGNKLAELDAVLKERTADEKNIAKAGIAFSLLQKYANALEALTSPDPPVRAEKQLMLAGSGFDRLIRQYNDLSGETVIRPGTGTILLKPAGKLMRSYLAARQVHEAARMVAEADTMVAVLCREMNVFLAGMGKLADIEETGIREGFRFYFTRTGDCGTEGERAYLSLMKRVGLLKKAGVEAGRAAMMLREAHGRLSRELNRKSSAAEIIASIREFLDAAGELEELVKSLTDHKIIQL